MIILLIYTCIIMNNDRPQQPSRRQPTRNSRGSITARASLLHTSQSGRANNAGGGSGGVSFQLAPKIHTPIPRYSPRRAKTISKLTSSQQQSMIMSPRQRRLKRLAAKNKKKRLELVKMESIPFDHKFRNDDDDPFEQNYFSSSRM